MSSVGDPREQVRSVIAERARGSEVRDLIGRGAIRVIGKPTCRTAER